MKHTCGPTCRNSGYTIVVSECGYHGSFHLQVFKHIAGVHVDDLPVVLSGDFGAFEGAHEFYDEASRAFQVILEEVGRID